MQPKIRSTTVLCVRRDNKVVMAGDGQVTLVGVGEGLDDLRPFDPQDFARALVSG